MKLEAKERNLHPLPYNRKKKGIYIRCLIDNYSKEALENIVKLSGSMVELALNLGYKTGHGLNYKTIQNRLNQYDITTEHFKKYEKPKQLKTEDVFCENSLVSQATLRRWCLKNKGMEYKCFECNIEPFWNGKSLHLQLDHKDGNNKNNVLSNLRWLCPNCHSQTKNFAGKNIHKERELFYCVDCGVEISRDATRCRRCASILRKGIVKLSEEDLKNILLTHNGNFTAVAKIYKVSDNTIRNWCKKYDIPTHSSSYVAPRLNRKRGQSMKPIKVKQIEPCTNKVIAVFDSINEAQRQTGISHIHSASNPCSRRKTAGGYLWERIPID